MGLTLVDFDDIIGFHDREHAMLEDAELLGHLDLDIVDFKCLDGRDGRPLREQMRHVAESSLDLQVCFSLLGDGFSRRRCSMRNFGR